MSNGGFTIAGLRPMGVVVEYVCSYTFVISGVTSQVRVRPTVTAEVRLQEGGEYTVQVRPHSLFNRFKLQYCTITGIIAINYRLTEQMVIGHAMGHFLASFQWVITGPSIILHTITNYHIFCCVL